MSKKQPIVGVIMGSQSDWSTMRHTKETLDALGIDNETKIISAHRTPERLAEYAHNAKQNGLKIIIAGAGMAAALPGATSALTPLPVLGVPMEGKLMGGLDALLSMAQMPAGVPVGTLAIGKAGAVNAAVLAASILALSDKTVEASLLNFRQRQSNVSNENPQD